MAKIITNLCIKGGVGKTTTTILLAMYLSKIGKKVLVVDFDRQGNAESALMDVNTNHFNLINVFNEECELRDAVQHGNICDVVASGIQMKALDVVLANVLGKDTLMQDYIKCVKNDYDYIICDVPPVEGTALNNALSITDFVLIPSEIGVFSLKGIEDMAPLFKQAKRINPTLKIQGIFLNRVKENTILQKEISELLSQISIKIGTKFYNTKIPDSIKIQEAQYLKKNVFLSKKIDKVFQNFEMLANEIILDIEGGN